MGTALPNVDARCFSKTYWNEWANHPTRTYNKLAKKFRYQAPEVIAGMAYPYLGAKSAVLDAGCGTGLLGKFLLSLDLDLEIDGIDFSSGMVNRIPDGVYDNVFFGDLSDESPVIVPDRPPYNALVSSGVYGEFVSVKSLPKLMHLLDKEATVAICGKSGYIEEAPDILEGEGFEIRESRDALSYSRESIGMSYKYIVATR